GVPPARPDRGAEPRDPRGAGGPPAARPETAPPADPVRNPGRERPADVHPLQHPRAAADVPQVRRAQDPRGLRPPPHAGQGLRPPPERTIRVPRGITESCLNESPVAAETRQGVG